VWHKPIIRLADSLYFWPITSLFVSYGVEMLEDSVLTSDKIRKAYFEKSRADFLEQEAARLLAQAFPMAQILRRVKWTPRGTKEQCETDILVMLDSTIIVVEAKSGRVTEPARYGYEARLKRDVEKLIAHAAQQSHRFITYFTSSRVPVELVSMGKAKHRIDPRKIHQVLRVNVTLDDIGPIGAFWPRLVRDGLVDEAVPPVPTMSLASLEHLLDLLDGPSQRLHYLALRADLESRYAYVADEMDLLAAYIVFGLDFDMVGRKDDAFLELYGASKMFDPWLMREFLTYEVEKPRREMTNWWQNLISQVETRAAYRWSEVGVTLLNVDPKDQITFEQACARGVENTRLNPNTTVLDSMAHILPKHAENGIVVAAIYKGLSLHSVRQTITPYVRTLVGDDPGNAVVIALKATQDSHAISRTWIESGSGK
jgi:hypothetical protein